MQTIKELFKQYGLTASDYFQNNHYTIINRQGIEKIQAIAKIEVNYEVVRMEKDYAVIKAFANMDGVKAETYGSALHGGKVKKNVNGRDKWVDTGTCNTLYIAEMAEKRALSRAILKVTGFYKLGAYGEDEAEDFKREMNEAHEQQKDEIEINNAKKQIDGFKTRAELVAFAHANKKELEGYGLTQYVKDKAGKLK